jgi:MFS family permease
VLTKIFSNKKLPLIFLSIFLFAVAIGMDVVTFPTLLTKHGISPTKVGIASTFEVIASIIMSFLLAKIVARFGLFKSLLTNSLIYAAAIALIFFYKNFYIWLAIVFSMGACWFACTIMRQAWLNIIVSDKNRGIINGIYSMIISGGLALGPVIVKFLGAENYFSFLTSALLIISSIAVLIPLRNTTLTKIDSVRIPLKTFFKNNPRCFLGRFFLDLQCYCLIIFTVIFGKKIGLKPEQAGLLFSAFMASGFFDIFVGFFLKKHSAYKIINIGFLGGLTCFSIISLIGFKALPIAALHDPENLYELLIVLYFLFGMSVACVYVAVMTLTNNDYKKSELIAANSTLQVIGSSGSLFGGLIGGISIQAFGAAGFPIAIILSCICYLTFFVFYEKKFTK